MNNGYRQETLGRCAWKPVKMPEKNRHFHWQEYVNIKPFF